MLSFLSSYFNPYNRKARLQPALLSVLPALVACILLIPELRTIWAAIGGIVIYGGASTLLTQLGRDRGKALEPKLFQFWGGKPSTAMLRYRDARLMRSTKDRYRAHLARAVPGLKLASPEDEDRSPLDADVGYEDATAWLLAQTRDRARFGLLFQENVGYGFRRNTWALKPLALAVDAVTIAMVLVLASDSWTGDLTTTIPAVGVSLWASMALAVLHLLLYTFVIRSDWVKIPAEAYARQLLAACDGLQDQRP